MNKYILFLIGIFALLSCSKENISSTGVALLNVKIAKTEFSDAAKPSLKASNNAVVQLEENTVSLGDGLLISVHMKSSTSSTNKVATTVTQKPNLQQPLDDGVHIRLLIFDANNRFLESREIISGEVNGETIQLYSNQRYSFIAYSYGERVVLPALNLNVGDELNKVLLMLNSVKDAMYTTKMNVSLQAGQNDLEFVLKHVFTKIKTSIDASEAGTIAHVGEFSVFNVFQRADLRFNANDFRSIVRDFNSTPVSQILPDFVISASNDMASSPAQLIYADGNLEQSLILKSLKINNLEKENVTLLKYNFQPGVFYDIEIKVKRVTTDPPEEEGFIIGNLMWAAGNLKAIKENGVYKYINASNQGEYGDYWYKNDNKTGYYDIPMKDQPGHNDVDILKGNVVKDICSLVGNGWRVPTPAEINSLRESARFDMKWNNTHKFVQGYYIDQDGKSIKGLFLGTKIEPDEREQNKYLFLPYAGMYNSGKQQGTTSIGSYWHTGRDSDSGYTYQFTEAYFNQKENGSDHPKRSNPIRCVKDQPIII